MASRSKGLRHRRLCINAARYLFRAEPKEVTAISVNSGTAKLAEIDESTGALLRFEGERVAAFVTSSMPPTWRRIGSWASAGRGLMCR